MYTEELPPVVHELKKSFRSPIIRLSMNREEQEGKEEKQKWRSKSGKCIRTERMEQSSCFWNARTRMGRLKCDYVAKPFNIINIKVNRLKMPHFVWWRDSTRHTHVQIDRVNILFVCWILWHEQLVSCCFCFRMCAPLVSIENILFSWMAMHTRAKQFSEISLILSHI